MDELIKIIQTMQDRIELLERANTITKVTIPSNGKLTVDSQTSDPPAENGRIYYNTATNKYKVCENGVWKTITTS